MLHYAQPCGCTKALVCDLANTYINSASPNTIEISNILAQRISAWMWLIFIYLTGIHR
ncbi:hypothetical protein M917_2836 [Psychrobacter aquaticus CMS 56]|uniref:Uncharacterized protein n=1 Tax=Psychrobacter aquaticus CMS 56 TaxID=1354303 RepID=U4T6B0_9GAMM|nr:hypothetical protein M917_2836 [Psychrobacter aquaticus CMS 56]